MNYKKFKILKKINQKNKAPKGENKKEKNKKGN